MFNAAVVVVIFGMVPTITSAGVCSEDMVSGLNGIPDFSITASSEFGSKDPMHNFATSRGRLNTTEYTDPTGVINTGGWSAASNDLKQWIQAELAEPSLIRGVMTQGRNGCCKQWVSKYRVQYSMDCKHWTPVGGFNVSDTEFKANSDEDTIATNTFHCPVIAKCIRIQPTEWHNQIAMRFGLLGCPIVDSSKSTTGAVSTAAGQTTTPAKTKATQPVTTTSAPATTIAAATTSMAAQSTTIAKTTTVAKATTTFPIVTTTTTTTTTKPATTGSGAKKCVNSCKGKANGDHQSCTGCDHYITCVWGSLIDNRPCPQGLKWNDNYRMCDFPPASTCP